MVPEPIRRLVERIVPWYDPELERARAVKSARLAARTSRAQSRADAARIGYLDYAERLRR